MIPTDGKRLQCRKGAAAGIQDGRIAMAVAMYATANSGVIHRELGCLTPKPGDPLIDHRRTATCWASGCQQLAEVCCRKARARPAGLGLTTTESPVE